MCQDPIVGPAKNNAMPSSLGLRLWIEAKLGEYEEKKKEKIKEERAEFPHVFDQDCGKKPDQMHNIIHIGVAARTGCEI